MLNLLMTIFLPFILFGVSGTVDPQPIRDTDPVIAVLEPVFFEDGSGGFTDHVDWIASACIYPSMGCIPDTTDDPFTVDQNGWVTFTINGFDYALCTTELDYAAGDQFPADLTDCN